MKIYKIDYTKQALKFLKKQPKTTQIKLIKVIEQLPDGTDIKKLKGKENLYRTRLGDIRILYSIYQNILTIEVVNIGFRGDVYKNL